jgi:hypothetical protein
VWENAVQYIYIYIYMDCLILDDVSCAILDTSGMTRRHMPQDPNPQ